jgi:hypothetical protein
MPLVLLMFISSISSPEPDPLEDRIEPYPPSSVSISNISPVSSSVPETDVFPRADVLVLPVLLAEPVLLRVLAIEDLLLDVPDSSPVSSLIDSFSSVPIELLLEEAPVLPADDDDPVDLFDSVLSFLDLVAICILLFSWLMNTDFIRSYVLYNCTIDHL